ncbi:MAG: hypothetical protein K6F64_07715 [Clostridia bacterium]|nr:hypothetical protein [Clostridia bacterium]
MALNKRKTYNIITAAIIILAVVLATVVLLGKTGVFKERQTEAESSEVTVTKIVEKSTVNEDGDIVYYTMVETYIAPNMSANHTYKTTTKKQVSTEEGEVEYYIEMTEVEPVTDEDGNPVFDENGELVTNVVTYTVPTDEEGNVIEESSAEESSETSTTVDYYEINGQTVTDIHGDPIVKPTISNPFSRRHIFTTEESTTKEVSESSKESKKAEVKSTRKPKTTSTTTKPTTVKPGASSPDESTTESTAKITSSTAKDSILQNFTFPDFSIPTATTTVPGTSGTPVIGSQPAPQTQSEPVTMPSAENNLNNNILV